MKYNKDVALISALALAWISEGLNYEEDKELLDSITPTTLDVIDVLDDYTDDADIIKAVLKAINNIQVYAEEYEALEWEVE